MAGLISKIKGMQAFSIGMALVLVQGLLGVEHMVLTLVIVATGALFALMDISKAERMGWMVFIIFLAVVGIGGLAKVPMVPAFWASISEPLMIFATTAGFISGIMMARDTAE